MTEPSARRFIQSMEIFKFRLNLLYLETSKRQTSFPHERNEMLPQEISKLLQKLNSINNLLY